MEELKGVFKEILWEERVCLSVQFCAKIYSHVMGNEVSNYARSQSWN